MLAERGRTAAAGTGAGLGAATAGAAGRSRQLQQACRRAAAAAPGAASACSMCNSCSSQERQQTSGSCVGLLCCGVASHRGSSLSLFTTAANTQWPGGPAQQQQQHGSSMSELSPVAVRQQHELTATERGVGAQNSAFATRHCNAAAQPLTCCMDG